MMPNKGKKKKNNVYTGGGHINKPKTQAQKKYNKALSFRNDRIKKLNTPGGHEKVSGGPGTAKKKKNYRH